jgi:hypothetical protein
MEEGDRDVPYGRAERVKNAAIQRWGACVPACFGAHSWLVPRVEAVAAVAAWGQPEHLGTGLGWQRRSCRTFVLMGSSG